ncbi:MAG: (2Fe-2S)-binding protein [Candidatus Cloacimonetes bacterium]|nr:(2Fe-2S)-binding protein [Candidatus Cloacimonadota bacterium]
MHEKQMSIDGKRVSFLPTDKNIVEVAKRNKIALPAPCYNVNRINGCCKVCVVEIAGKIKYACTTAPAEDMVVIVNRTDLKELRKERIEQYQNGEKDNAPCECSCSNSDCC